MPVGHKRAPEVAIAKRTSAAYGRMKHQQEPIKNAVPVIYTYIYVIYIYIYHIYMS
jgi:hypothetical protein